MALPSLLEILKAARAVEKVFELDEVLKKSIGDLDKRLTLIEQRLIVLEAEKQQLVTEAKAAAATAASVAASAHLTELARQVSVMQEQIRGLRAVADDPRRLPPPEAGGG